MCVWARAQSCHTLCEWGGRGTKQEVGLCLPEVCILTAGLQELIRVLAGIKFILNSVWSRQKSPSPSVLQWQSYFCKRHIVYLKDVTHLCVLRCVTMCVNPAEGRILSCCTGWSSPLEDILAHPCWACMGVCCLSVFCLDTCTSRLLRYFQPRISADSGVTSVKQSIEVKVS